MARITLSQAPSHIAWLTLWKENTQYSSGQKVSCDGDVFFCLSSHTSQTSNRPGTGENWSTYWTIEVDVYPIQDIRIDGGNV